MVGRHDRASETLGFFGSTCRRLMQAAPCAVLAVAALPALPVPAARLSA